MTHSHLELDQVRELPLGEGGRTLLLAARKPPFYAGRRRASTNYSFEAALTFLEGQAYREIVAATAHGSNIPKMPLDGTMTAGVLDGIWRIRGTSSIGVEPPPVPQNKIDFGKRQKQNGFGADTKTLHSLQNKMWAERCAVLLGEVERCAGWEWRDSGSHRRLSSSSERVLFIIDDQMLYPPLPENLKDADFPSPHQLATLGPRFANLPGLIRDTRMDLVILCSSWESAQALQNGEFLEYWLGGKEHKELLHRFPQFHWPKTPIATVPSLNAAQPFGRFHTAARSDEALYNVLRTVPPTIAPSPIDELRGMVGMSQIVDRLEELEDTAHEALERKRQGLPPLNFNLNTALYGNPGTGKTTVARIIGRILGELGLLSGTKFTEATRASLVAGYVGQTALRTRAICESALGGVLFIDEAYSLARGGEQDFGNEAVDELIRWMSEANADLAVIVAGYPKEMELFLPMNPGLAGRINFHIHMPDYTDDELVQIAGSIAARGENRIEKKAEAVILQRIRAHREACQRANQTFRNAGEVEKLVRAAITSRAKRRRADPNQNRDALTLLTFEDFQNARLDAPSPSK